METEKIRCANPLGWLETQALTQYWATLGPQPGVPISEVGGSRGMEGCCKDRPHSLDFQQETAQEAVKALRAGASVGQVFEVVRPWARHFPGEPQTQGKPWHARPILSTFGSEAVERLINANATDLLAFFEKAAEPRALQLRRPN